VCSGQALAEQGTHITVALLLWGFHFEKKRDAQGKEIDIDIFDYTNGLNWRPQPFECVIRPRSKKILEAIRREGEKALEELQVYNGTTRCFPIDMVMTDGRYRMSEFYAKAANGEKVE